MFLMRDIKVNLPSAARETLRRNSKLCGQHFRSSSDGLSTRSTKDFPSESFGCKGGGFSSMVHILFLANPCCSSDPQFPNCGKHTGIPPRIAFGGLKIALLLVNRSSSPLSLRHEVTWPPCKLTLAEAPCGFRRTIWSIPFQSFVNPTAALWSQTGAECPISKNKKTKEKSFLSNSLLLYFIQTDFPKNFKFFLKRTTQKQRKNRHSWLKRNTLLILTPFLW